MLITLFTGIGIYVGVIVVAYIIQERFIFVPSIRLEPPQFDIATPHEELFFDSAHKGKIHGLLLFHPNPKGLIFYLHGNTGNLGRWKYMAEEISRYGFNVVAIDYRGYGKSKGKRSEKIMHDDCVYCCREVQKRFENLPLIIYGRSLGTGFATQLAYNVRCSKLVLETPFKNLLDVAASYFPFLPMKLLLKYNFRSDLILPKIECPVMILHGTKDRIVPYRSAIELYNCARQKQNIKMITIPGGRHNNLNAFPLFVESLRSFLSE